jgi:hypothetical protein
MVLGIKGVTMETKIKGKAVVLGIKRAPVESRMQRAPVETGIQRGGGGVKDQGCGVEMVMGIEIGRRPAKPSAAAMVREREKKRGARWGSRRGES